MLVLTSFLLQISHCVVFQGLLWHVYALNERYGPCYYKYHAKKFRIHGLNNFYI